MISKHGFLNNVFPNIENKDGPPNTIFWFWTLYFQTFSFHHSISKFCGPHNKLLCLDEFWVTVFITQSLRKMDASDQNWKLKTVFKFWKLKLSGKVVKKPIWWDPFSWVVSIKSDPLHQRLFFFFFSLFLFFSFLSSHLFLWTSASFFFCELEHNTHLT